MSAIVDVKIESIAVGHRYRRDLGDITTLAESIRTLGLLQPIGIDGANHLVFGSRRLEAVRSLGWPTIQAKVIDSDALLAEINENLVRKDFTVSERVAIAMAIRMRIGDRQGQRTDIHEAELRKNICEVEPGKRTDQIVAKAAGFGNETTMRQAEQVVEHGSPELVEALDNGKVSIYAATALLKLSEEEQVAILAKGEEAIAEQVRLIRKGTQRALESAEAIKKFKQEKEDQAQAVEPAEVQTAASGEERVVMPVEGQATLVDSQAAMPVEVQTTDPVEVQATMVAIQSAALMEVQAAVPVDGQDMAPAEIPEPSKRGAQAALAGLTGNNEWYTPPEWIERARAVMGSIDVDPASNAVAQGKVGALVWYDKETDGLAHDWPGNVWLNPPYSRALIDSFVDRLINQYRSGITQQAVVLVDNRTDTRWFHTLFADASAVAFTKGRVNFYNEAVESSSPANGSVFVYFGLDVEAFARVFGSVCSVTIPYRFDGANDAEASNAMADKAAA